MKFPFCNYYGITRHTVGSQTLDLNAVSKNSSSSKVAVEVVAVDAVDISAVEEYTHERKMRSKNPTTQTILFIFLTVWLRFLWQLWLDARIDRLGISVLFLLLLPHNNANASSDCCLASSSSRIFSFSACEKTAKVRIVVSAQESGLRDLENRCGDGERRRGDGCWRREACLK